MQSERPECQCLACAQLQHHQANDTLLLVAIGTVVVVGGLVWLVGQVAGLLASVPGRRCRCRSCPASWSACATTRVTRRRRRGRPTRATACPARWACTPPWPPSWPPRWR
jgi:hypothetical protein